MNEHLEKKTLSLGSDLESKQQHELTACTLKIIQQKCALLQKRSILGLPE